MSENIDSELLAIISKYGPREDLKSKLLQVIKEFSIPDLVDNSEIAQNNSESK